LCEHKPQLGEAWQISELPAENSALALRVASLERPARALLACWNDRLVVISPKDEHDEQAKPPND